MTLDRIPETMKTLQLKLQRNISTAYIQSGNYSQAIETLETIISKSTYPGK